MRIDLKRIDGVAERFIYKNKRVNQPLESFRETESFKQFKGKFARGINKQKKWLIDNLGRFDRLFDDTLSEHDFKSNFGAWLKNEMPSMSEYVAESKIYTYLYNAFDWSITASYGRMGYIRKAEGFIDFELTNDYYIAALKNQANYLLYNSSIDETTRKRMINLIRDSRLSLNSLDELASMIEAEFEGYTEDRGFLIANTETNQAMSTAQHAFLTENGFATKLWVGAGPRTCPICMGNEDDGPILLDQAFSSGDMNPPGHAGCECYLDAGEETNIDSIDVLWDGS